MGDNDRSVSRYSLGAEAALCALVPCMALSLGGAPTWVVWPLVLLSAAAFSLSLVGSSRQRQSVWVRPATLVPLVILGVAVLQVVPLPAGLLGLLSPQGASLRTFTLVPLGLERARPVSMDPASTWREVARHAAYLFIVLAATQVARNRRSRRRLFAMVALTGVAVALIGLGHRLVGAEKLFGFYSFSHQLEFLSTFGNLNHLAGLMTLSGAAALGLAISTSERPVMFGWVLAVLTCGTAVMFTGSRGGIGFFGVALALLGLLSWRHARTTSSNRPYATLIPLVTLAAVVGLGAYLAWETVLPRMQSVSSLEKIREAKVDLWPSFAQGAMAYWPMGMGRGAFELAFTPWQTSYPSIVFTHPENLVLQLLAEQGVVFGSLALALMVMTLVLIARDRPGALEVAAIAGLVAIGLHDLFDFALELPATAVAACLVVGTASARAKRRGWSLSPMVAGAAGAVVLVLALVGAVASRPDFHDAEQQLAGLIEANAKAPAVRAAAVELIDRHPADYVLYALTARSLSGPGGQPQDALAWVNRALALRPSDGASHRAAARALLKLGKRSQALLEYRLAREAGLGSLPDVFNEGLQVSKSLEDLLVLIQTPADAAEGANRLRASGRAGEGQALIEHFLSTGLTSEQAVPLWLLLAAFGIEAQHYDDAQKALDQAALVEKDSLRVLQAKASLLQRQGNVEGAVAMLKPQTVRHPDDVPLAFNVASLLIGVGRPREARDGLQRVSPFIVNPQDRVQKMMLDAQSWEAQQGFAKAASSYQSAARLAPNWAHPRFQAARVFELEGKFNEARMEVLEGFRAEPASRNDATLKWLASLEQHEAERRQQPAVPVEPTGEEPP